MIKTPTTQIALAMLLLGALARVAFIGSVPGGLNQDEASIGYDAWALLTTGIDRWGVSWPIHFISWGSGQNALYAYLSFPFIAIGGLSVTTIRLTAATLGCVTLILFWLLGKKRSESMGLIALLIIATSPWHIMASRWALESNAAPAFVLFGTYLLCNFRVKPNIYLPLGCALICTSMYAYGTAYFFVPLFLFTTFLILLIKREIHFVQLLISGAVALTIAAPLVLFIYNNSHGTEHITFGPFTIPKYPGEARYSGLFLPFVDGGFSKIPANALDVLQMWLGGKSDGLPWNASPAWGPQFVLLTPFIFYGIALTLRERNTTDSIMLVWLILALLTAFCTTANINRINLIWIPSLWIAARAITELSESIRAQRVVIASIAIYGVLFCFDYFSNWQKHITERFYHGLGEAIQFTIENTSPNDIIAITQHSNYMSTLFFAKVPPERYIASASIPNREAAFISVNSFDRFIFGINRSQKSKYLGIVAHKSEINLFDPETFKITVFDDYASIIKRSIPSCALPLPADQLGGTQDHGSLGINSDVYGQGNGVTLYKNQYFKHAISVHGDSNWQMPIPQGAKGLSFGVGMGDRAKCSDGITFKILLDDKMVFSSKVNSDDFSFNSINISKQQRLTLITEAGSNNACDHGVWIQPTFEMCPNGPK